MTIKNIILGLGYQLALIWLPICLMFVVIKRSIHITKKLRAAFSGWKNHKKGGLVTNV